MTDTQKADEGDKQPEKTAEAEAPASEEKKKAEELENMKRLRAQECTKKFQGLLKEYNCYTDIFITIGTNGSLKGEIRILAR